jgi:hypothetical protein
VKLNWAATGVIVALVGLIGTTWYNAHQVRKGAQQAQETRQATQVQLFTQLDNTVGQSTHDLLLHRGEILRALGDPRVQLSTKTRADVVKAFNDRNYLAALINNRIITDRRLTVIWAAVLSCDYQNVLKPLGDRIASNSKHSYGELRILFERQGCDRSNPFHGTPIEKTPQAP